MARISDVEREGRRWLRKVAKGHPGQDGGAGHPSNGDELFFLANDDVVRQS